MLNFIICDDNKVIRENVNKVITKLMLPTDIEYKVAEFEKYDKDFAQLIDRKTEKKIFILDVEMNSHSGLDVARKIREKDWESIIIILTAHYELAYEAFKNRLLLLDFLSKFDNYEHNLYEALKTALKISHNKKQLSFESKRTSYRIDFDEILYIFKDTENRKTVIKTFSKDYSVSLNLNEIEVMLPETFIKTHRACVVNSNNIKTVDFKENIIVFKNGEKINLLSKNYRKEVKKYVFS
jgi:two-component system response regulator AgrA